ncbi:phage holin, lambda family [compost metagenome]
MALLITVLRVVYDRKERAWQRILLEALLCGLLTVAGTSLTALAIAYWAPTFQAPMAHIAVGVGGTIGFFGVEAVRRTAIRVLGIKLRSVERDGKGES